MKREVFYKNSKINFEIVKQLRGKEVTFIEKPSGLAVRCVKAHSIKYLKDNFERFGFFHKNMNLYYSWANFKDMPAFSFNPEKRRNQYAEWNRSGFNECIADIDFAIDIDSESGNLKDALNDAVGISELFNSYSLPFSVSFSGSKGFHVEIPAKYHSQIEFLPSEAMRIFKIVISKLKKDFPCVDDTIYDTKRIFKCKYSIDCNSGLVCLPLSSIQLNDFKTSIARPENVVSIKNLGFRGMLNRNLASHDRMKPCFDNFISSFV